MDITEVTEPATRNNTGQFSLSTHRQSFSKVLRKDMKLAK